MEHLNMQTTNIVDENIKRIGELFPNCLTECKDDKGHLRIVIDFEKLKQELSEDAVGEGKERYQFTWPDKRHAIRLSNLPITDTLRPYREESVDFDTTQNLYIEGDNLNVLKLLRENYLSKVKLIYIDPPYNTGGDFIYRDNFIRKNSDYKEISGSYDEEGNILVGELEKNADSNGRFHTDWLNMLYPRLKVAKELLSDDGVIFISIDDNEVENLRKICDEVFGAPNFIAQIIVDGTPKNDPYVVSTAHEYCLVFCKNYDLIKEAQYGVSNPVYKELIDIYHSCNGDYSLVMKKLKDYFAEKGLSSDNIANYKYADKKGIYRIGPIDDPQNSGARDTRYNPNTGRKVATPSRGWSCNLSTWEQWIKEDLIVFPDDETTLPAKKTYITADRLDVMRAFFKIQTRKDTDYLKKLFELPITPFQNPKPVELIKQFIKNCNDKKMIVLDFFSGSATTAQACIEANKEDCGKRKFILIQLPEKIEITSGQSNKAKKITQAAIDFCNKHKLPCTICEIGKERIRRAGKMIKEESPLTTQDLDIGFRVLKLDSSNMEDVYYRPEESNEKTLFEDNIKPGRSSEDLLFQVMLECNLPLSAKIETEMIAGKEVFTVNDGYLMACFDEKVNENVIKEVAKRKPYYFVMRDSSMATDNVADNFEQIFQAYSKDTIRRVL